MHSWSTFGARMSHGKIQILKTHHGSNLGQATTFPLIIYFVPFHEGHIQMTFCLGTLATLGPHNFVCKPPIDMKFQAKL
jgi:hypothetical protein